MSHETGVNLAVEEVWRDIPGYEGRYQASSFGRIRTVAHYVRCGKDGNGQRLVAPRVLRPGKYSTGHLSVTLGSERKSRSVHSLVALTFLGPRPEGMEVCHNDNNPRNNRVDNLRYDTRQKNVLDAYNFSGKLKKLTTEDVHEIRRRLSDGEMCKDIAKDYDVNASTISGIKNGREFGWLE